MGSNEDHEQRKCRRLADENAEVQPVQTAGGRDSGNNGEQDHPQNVVKNRRSKNDLGSPRSEHMHVGQHAGSNSHACSHHCRAYENSFSSGIAANLHVGEAENEGRDDSCHGHQQRLAADSNQCLRTRLQTGAEQHENRAYFRNRVDRVAGRDPVQRVRTEPHSGQNFT